MSGKFDELVAIIRKLRGKKGCPWDRQQDRRSILNYLIEETYELVDAVENQDDAKAREELGDVMMLLVFLARVAQEEKAFTLDQAISTINRKLIRRHPHVFKSTRVTTVQDVADNWDKIKQREKKRKSVLDGVPRYLPALNRALRMQKRAAQVGFDWEKIDDVFAKVEEELKELKAEHRARRRKAYEEELGDALFALVNLARFMDVNPEAALRRTLRKFDTRFRYIEKELKKQGLGLNDVGLNEMDALWEKAKSIRKKS
jgi:tetrapyrrole methylase family protein/MazG family protein